MHNMFSFPHRIITYASVYSKANECQNSLTNPNLGERNANLFKTRFQISTMNLNYVHNTFRLLNSIFHANLVISLKTFNSVIKWNWLLLLFSPYSVRRSSLHYM